MGRRRSVLNHLDVQSSIEVISGLHVVAHVDTAEISLFDTGVGQESIDEGHIHSYTLKNL